MLKNITLSADAELIRRARDKARQEKTTLNETFRLWLARYTKAGTRAADYDGIMERLQYAQPGRHFTRAEANER